jgi:hypothetical protein
LPLALAAAGPRATIAVLAAPGCSSGGSGPSGVNPPALSIPWADEVTVTGVAGCHPDLVPELCALAAKGELDLASLVEVVPLDDVSRRLAERERTPTPTTLVVSLPASPG